MERDGYRREIVEHTSPGWRVLGVGLTVAGGIVFGSYLQEAGLADEFATVAAVAILYTLKSWAKTGPARSRTRAGPGRVFDVVREEAEGIDAWISERALWVKFAIAVVYGVVLVAVRTVILLLITSLYDWKLAAALGLVVGGAAAAPQLYGAVGGRLSGASGADTDGTLGYGVGSPEVGAGIEGGESMSEIQNTEESRPENDNAGIGYYDAEGNQLSPEEFQRVVARDASEARLRDDEEGE